MKELIGILHAKNMKMALVVSRFNDLITRNLLEGALDALKRHGVNPNEITIAWVPGSLELPLIAKKMADSGNYDAVICLGAVIRGATSHYDLVVNQTASGLMKASLDSGVPILMGVLTTENIEQALERSGVKMGNKGYDVVVAAIEMVNLIKSL